MKSSRLMLAKLFFAVSCMPALQPTLSCAQTTTTGELSGMVADSTGAVLAHAAVALNVLKQAVRNLPKLTPLVSTSLSSSGECFRGQVELGQT
jgi:hypothetical protein